MGRFGKEFMKLSEIVRSLFVKHNDELHRYVSKKLNCPNDAEEVVQEVFYNYMRMDDAENVENPRAFLYKTANNLALNHIRKSSYRSAHLNTLDRDRQTPTLEAEVFSQKDIDTLQASLNELPELTKVIFLMNRIEAKTYAEIAKEVNTSVSSIQKHMMAALKYLRKNLERF